MENQQCWTKQQLRARRALMFTCHWYQYPYPLAQLKQLQQKHLLPAWELTMLRQMYHDHLLALTPQHALYLTARGYQLAQRWFPSLAPMTRGKLATRKNKCVLRTYFIDGLKAVESEFTLTPQYDFLYLKNIDLDEGTYDLTTEQTEADWTTDWRDVKAVRQMFPQVTPLEDGVFEHDDQE